MNPLFLSIPYKPLYNVIPFLLLMLCSGHVQCQYGKNPTHDRILGTLRAYNEKNGPEKVYLQTDKDFYVNGETIWFKAYLVDGITHTQSPKSRVVYVELLDHRDSIVAQRKLHVKKMGAAGDIKIDERAQNGTYSLRAYTRYMLNAEKPLAYEKQIPVWTQDSTEGLIPKHVNMDKPQVMATAITGGLKPRFFPEGGHLVAGLPGTLAYEIKDNEGNFVSTEGRIQDSNGNIVAFLTTYEYGLGMSKFDVEPGKRYFAVFQHDGLEKRFPLPDVLEKGYVLNILNKGNHLIINVSTTIKNGLEGALLLGHLRGNVVLEKHMADSGSHSAIRFRLPTEGLSKGVAHFTLFSRRGEPLCERLVFVDHPKNQASLTLKTSKKDFDYRSPVGIALEITDMNQVPLSGELSMSVYTATNQLESKQGTSNIKSWLLLNSDLGGTVPNPDYFFKDNSDSRKRLLDVLMLTHGWRRFVWKDFTTESIARTPRFLPEKGLMVHGRTTSFQNPYQPLPTQVKLSILDNGIYQETRETNAQGKFSFGPLVFQDSASMILEAMTKDLKTPKDIGIHIDPVFQTKPIESPKKSHWGTLTLQKVSQYLQEVRQKKVTDFMYDPKVTILDEVTVTGQKRTRQELIDAEINRMSIYNQPSKRVFMDSIPLLNTGSALDALFLVAGVRVYGVYPNQRVVIRGCTRSSINLDPEESDNFFHTTYQESGPLFLLDGVPVEPQIIQYMRGIEVMFIDVLKGPETAVFGIRGACGVVAVYTHRRLQHLSAEPGPVPGIANFTIPGFYKAREFYAPDYSKDNTEHERPDYRTTLHWEPNIILKGKEKTSVHFYTGDTPGEYVIRVEGITEDGRPLSSLSRITVGGDRTKL